MATQLIGFGTLDWAVFAIFIGFLLAIGFYSQKKDAADAKDYFLAGGNVPSWLAAISTIATMQSAATFLGAPDYGYRGDFTYLGTNIGTIMGALFVGLVLIPRFYALKIATVYELLERRYGKSAMQAAGAMFLIGRVLAEGSRIYLAAIAVSMMIFTDVSFDTIVISSFLIVFFSFIICFFGGLKSVIWTDVALFFVYIGAAIGAFFYLLWLIPAENTDIITGLLNTPDGVNKLKLLDFSLDWSKPFSFFAIITGMFLLSTASFGLDQDISQRLLASKDAKTGAKSLYSAALWTLPIVALFLAIGQLLYVFYNRPDLMHTISTPTLSKSMSGENVTSFLYFIMTQIPTGLRALATIGVLAAAISTVNSGLNSMSSVLIQDFYKPFHENKMRAKNIDVGAHHYVNAGRYGMAIVGVFLLGMAVLSFEWQKSGDIPLLQFVLGVMTFAYAGLLGVYFTAIFTDRGSQLSVIFALIIGFMSILMMQPWIAEKLNYPQIMQTLAFPWQLCIGTFISFLICMIGDDAKTKADII